ncbi:hypothetical protein T4B_4225 [Trichinella pseudospiralis]|uniref:Uncharacterized protein n=2 Tax=Trichinella pseudospiralis TaxID=6337 RepID=A0A0V1F5T2_TRIPS|nr:hypothetical protein T4D_16378 [Trichinella pseudospiralis]KRZ07713.1 hypothetical protein T4B_4225 [Trichinella pseudospiralis]
MDFFEWTWKDQHYEMRSLFTTWMKQEQQNLKKVSITRPADPGSRGRHPEDREKVVVCFVYLGQQDEALKLLTTMHDLCQCLRCVNFYRSFIAQAAWLLAPLETFPSTNGTSKRDTVELARLYCCNNNKKGVGPGAMLRVVSFNAIKKQTALPAHTILKSYNGTINMSDTCILLFEFHRRPRQLSCIVADASQMLLSADFHSVHSLHRDIKIHRLINLENFNADNLWSTQLANAANKGDKTACANKSAQSPRCLRQVITSVAQCVQFKKKAQF